MHFTEQSQQNLYSNTVCAQCYKVVPARWLRPWKVDTKKLNLTFKDMFWCQQHDTFFSKNRSKLKHDRHAEITNFNEISLFTMLYVISKIYQSFCLLFEYFSVSPVDRFTELFFFNLEISCLMIIGGNTYQALFPLIDLGQDSSALRLVELFQLLLQVLYSQDRSTVVQNRFRCNHAGPFSA